MDKDRLERAAQLEVPLYPLIDKIRPNYICDTGFGLKTVKEDPESHVTGWISGRVTQINNLGKIMFLFVKRDDKLWQICFTKDQPFFSLAKKLQVGDIISTTGFSFRTEQGKLALYVTELTLLTKAMKDPGKVLAGNIVKDVEKLHRQPYLKMIQEDLKVLRLRAQIIHQIRAFLAEQSFVEVETPMLLPVNSGAIAKPFTTHYNSLGADFYLRVAPELALKRLLVGGMERVFEIGKNFRNEGMDKTHNPEFTSLELYSAYNNANQLIELLVNLLKSISLVLHEGLPDVEIITMKDLVRQRISGDEVPYEKLNEYFEIFVAPFLQDPIIVTDYPIYCSPLAKAKDELFADRFEFYWKGMEIANGFSEENNPVEQRKKFLSQAAKKDEQMGLDEDFLTALEYGMPPSAGLGIGIDRLVMCLLGLTDINDVIAFPQYKKEKTQ